MAELKDSFVNPDSANTKHNRPNDSVTIKTDYPATTEICQFLVKHTPEIIFKLILTKIIKKRILQEVLSTESR